MGIILPRHGDPKGRRQTHRRRLRTIGRRRDLDTRASFLFLHHSRQAHFPDFFHSVVQPTSYLLSYTRTHVSPTPSCCTPNVHMLPHCFKNVVFLPLAQYCGVGRVELSIL